MRSHALASIPPRRVNWSTSSPRCEEAGECVLSRRDSSGRTRSRSRRCSNRMSWDRCWTPCARIRASIPSRSSPAASSTLKCSASASACDSRSTPRPAMTGSGATPPTVQIHPTLRCNFRCRHCYSSSSPDSRTELSYELVAGALDDARDLGYEVLAVSGGEPFLYPDLLRVLRHAKTLGFTTTVTTNGSVLDHGRLERVAGHLDGIALSLDGPPAVHNRIRASPRFFLVPPRAGRGSGVGAPLRTHPHGHRAELGRPRLGGGIRGRVRRESPADPSPRARGPSTSRVHRRGSACRHDQPRVRARCPPRGPAPPPVPRAGRPAVARRDPR